MMTRQIGFDTSPYPGAPDCGNIIHIDYRRLCRG